LLAGTWQSGNVWGGVKEGRVRVGDFGPKVPAAVQQEVLARQKDMASGKLQPFAAGKAPVLNNSGAVVIAAGSALSDAQILVMYFLVQGGQGSLPK
jgi:simple sugar transport system substrate-binding protein